MKCSTGSSRSPLALVARDRRGDLLLVLEAHLIGLATTDQMKLVADTPEELEALPVSLHLQLAQQPHVEQIIERPHQGLGRAGHPQRRVVVAQATDPLLQIRLQQVEGAAVFFVALRQGLGLGPHEISGVRQKVIANRRRELVEEPDVPAQKARPDDGREDSGFAPTQGEGLFDAADRTAHLCACIP